MTLNLIQKAADYIRDTFFCIITWKLDPHFFNSEMDTLPKEIIKPWKYLPPYSLWGLLLKKECAHSGQAFGSS